MENIIIIGIAILPAIALMIYIYLQDNHEKEPIGLLLAIFGLGILSCIPSMLFEWLADKILQAIFGGVNFYVYWFVYAFLGVAIFEEFFKFLAARILTWRNRHFNYKFDGIVYCLFGSMGFAATENILYLISEKMMTGNSSAAIHLGIQRGLLAIPLHAMCAIFMGYYYGNAKYAKSYGDRSGCRTNLLLGFVIASSLHGFYDFCLFTGNQTLKYVFLTFVVIADIFTIIRIHFAKKNNQAMYIAPKYRGYWIGPEANPYQEFGGYQAPTYGGYNYGTTGPAYGEQGGPNPYAPKQTQSQYAPQQAQSPYAPQQAQSPYAPQQTQSPYTQQQPQSPYAPQQTQSVQPDNTYSGNGQTGYDQAGYGQTQPDIYGRPAASNPAPRNFRNQMVRCPNCGAANRFNAFYCSNCGSSIHRLNS